MTCWTRQMADKETTLEKARRLYRRLMDELQDEHEHIDWLYNTITLQDVLDAKDEWCYLEHCGIDIPDYEVVRKLCLAGKVDSRGRRLDATPNELHDEFRDYTTLKDTHCVLEPRLPNEGDRQIEFWMRRP